MTAQTHKVRSLLTPLLEATPAPALLFSAGIRSTLLGLLGRGSVHAALAVAVPGQSLDEPFIPRTAEALGLTVIWVRPDAETLLNLLPQTVKMLKTFEPGELRRGLVFHAAVLLAREFHLGTLWTGDTPRGEKSMAPAERLGHQLGVSIHTPLHHPSLRAWWEGLSPQEKTMDSHGRSWDQAPLRRLLADSLPEEMAFREPCPPETGAGTRAMSSLLEKKITDAAFAREARTALEEDGVTLRDKEHLACYQIYRSQFGPPPLKAS